MKFWKKSCLGENKIIPERNSVYKEEMNTIRTFKYPNKYKTFIFLIFKKCIWMLEAKITTLSWEFYIYVDICNICRIRIGSKEIY